MAYKVKKVYHIHGFLSYSQYKILMVIENKYIRILLIEIRNKILSAQFGTQNGIHNPLILKLYFNKK